METLFGSHTKQYRPFIQKYSLCYVIYGVICKIICGIFFFITQLVKQLKNRVNIIITIMYIITKIKITCDKTRQKCHKVIECDKQKANQKHAFMFFILIKGAEPPHFYHEVRKYRHEIQYVSTVVLRKTLILNEKEYLLLFSYRHQKSFFFFGI